LAVKPVQWHCPLFGGNKAFLSLYECLVYLL
jgi:hypothetical protein